jgi:predicted amidophosphoribosyltransferase
VPVPGRPAAVRRRGFDHAAVLARALARRADGPAVLALLERAGGPAQVGRGGASACAGRRSGTTGAPVPARVVLVDDVHTTGATFARARGRCGRPARPRSSR